MMTPQAVLGYVKAEPFRPFRLHMASGATFDIPHPEMVTVLKSDVLVFSFTSDDPAIFDEWQSVSLMLIESISHLEAQPVP